MQEASVSKLLKEIKSEYLKLRKERNPEKDQDKTSLSTFIGDLETEIKDGVEIDDVYVTESLNKARKTALSNYDLTHDQKFKDEAALYEQFLPKQLAEKDFIEIFEKDDFATIGEIMGYFKEHYNGRYVGAELSKVAKTYLATK